MALIKEVKGIYPIVGKDVYLAENVTITGDVVIGNSCNIWFNVVIRGDVNAIRIGEKTNIQDQTMIHGTYEKSPTIIGNKVSIGHRAIVHGCTLEDECLVGMGAIVMDDVIVQKHSIVAAGSVVLEKTIVESGWIYAGVPAKKVKQINAEQMEILVKGIADKYLLYATWMKE